MANGAEHRIFYSSCACTNKMPICSVMHLIFKRVRWPPIFFYVFNIILSFSTCSQSFKKICTWELLGANVLKRKWILMFFGPPVQKFWWQFSENQGRENFVLASCSFKAYCKLHRLAFTWLASWKLSLEPCCIEKLIIFVRGIFNSFSFQSLA